MTTYHYEIEQGTEEWHSLRNGILTASEMKMLITPALKKIANNDKVKAHVYEILAQRISGFTEPSYISDDMLRGQEDEVLAKALYSEKYAPVKDCGFITNESLGCVVGYSPDGLVGEDGLIEVKSRSQKHQIETIVTNEVPEEHIIQIQAGLLISGRKWCDYISYCGGHKMFVKRVLPDEALQKALTEAILAFEASVKSKMELYNKNAEGFYPTERRIEQEITI